MRIFLIVLLASNMLQAGDTAPAGQEILAPHGSFDSLPLEQRLQAFWARLASVERLAAKPGQTLTPEEQESFDKVVKYAQHEREHFAVENARLATDNIQLNKKIQELQAENPMSAADKAVLAIAFAATAYSIYRFIHYIKKRVRTTPTIEVE